MMKRLTAAITLALASIVGIGFFGAVPAFAHGEAAQEAFFKTRTLGFYDIAFSTTKMRKGDSFTVTGKFRILEAWPKFTAPTVENTSSYVTLAVPGPVVVITDREISGQFAFGRAALQTGKSYDFKITARARRTGRFHAHPAVAFKGIGSMLGPGEWITIEDGPAFKNQVQLASGKTVNLENYALRRVYGWEILAILIGAAWLVFWLGPRPLLMRAKILSTGQPDEEALVSTRDHRVGVIFAAVIGLVLIGGGAWAKSEAPVTLPQQVRRFTPEPLAENHFVTAKTVGTVNFVPHVNDLTWTVELTNHGQQPVTVKSFRTSVVTFGPGAHALAVEPNQPIGPGETRQVKLLMVDDAWQKEGLISLSDPQAQIAGLLEVVDTAGGRDMVEIGGELKGEYFSKMP